MRIRLRALFLIEVVAMLAMMANVCAQDAAPAPTPLPTPGSYPDIDALREPGSTAKLFPQEAPDASPGTGTEGTGARSGRRSRGIPGGGQQHRRSQRASDTLLAEADADPLEVRVAYRRAKTEAMVRDPGLAALLQDADAARTDVQKRAVLKVYYTRLFDGVRKIDPSPEMKQHVDLLAHVARLRYDPQRRTVGGEEDIILGGGGRRGRAR